MLPPDSYVLIVESSRYILSIILLVFLKDHRRGAKGKGKTRRDVQYRLVLFFQYGNR